MHASEFKNRAEHEGRIITVNVLDTERNDKPVGQARALLVDPDNRIAILLADCNAQETNLKAGDFVQVSGHPEARIQRIISADSIRPDAGPGQRAPGDPFLQRPDRLEE